MKVNELIAQLSQMPTDMDIKVVSIFDVDDIPMGSEWTEEEDIREAEFDNFDVWIEDDKQVVIQCFTPA